MTGFVYAIQSGDAVKIGWATNPQRRLTELNVGSPTAHVLLGFVAGEKADEAIAHSQCAAHRIRGEWFRIEGAVLAFIEHLPPLLPKLAHSENTRLCSDPSNSIGEAIIAAIAAAGSEARLAMMVGVSQPMINKAKKARRVSAALAVRIDAALAGIVSKEELCPQVFAPIQDRGAA